MCSCESTLMDAICFVSSTGWRCGRTIMLKLSCMCSVIAVRCESAMMVFSRGLCGSFGALVGSAM